MDYSNSVWGQLIQFVKTIISVLRVRTNFAQFVQWHSDSKLCDSNANQIKGFHSMSSS